MPLLFPFPIISYFLYSIPERGCKRRKITIAQSALTHTRTHIIVHFCPLCCCFANARPLRAKSRLASFVYVPTCIIYVDLYFFLWQNEPCIAIIVDRRVPTNSRLSPCAYCLQRVSRFISRDLCDRMLRENDAIEVIHP